MLSELVFVGDRCCDHSSSSGYDQLCTTFPEAGWLSERALASGALTWHRQPASQALGERPLFHVIYGDFSPAPALLRKQFPDAAIVATVHRPVARVLADPVGREVVRTADALIVVSTTQAVDLTGGAPECGPIHVVPHGVRPAAFWDATAGDGALTRDGVLLVGNHLRDWELAIQVVEGLAALGIRCTVLGVQDPIARLGLQPVAQLLGRVPEVELVRLYHESAALLLPVRDATASNALLEAMAAGCPVICPDLPSLVNEYLGDAVDAFPPGRADIAIERILVYLSDPDARVARSRVLAARAADLDWSRLRDRYADLYRSALERHPGRSGTCQAF